MEMIGGILKSTLFAFGLACAAHYLLSGIGSEYLSAFLKQNIVSLQIGLLAINAATLGVVLTKLRDLVDKGAPAETFAEVRAEMLLSIREQVGLIVFALVVLSFMEARTPPFVVSPSFLQILLITCFVYSLMILYDTAKSVFVVLGE